MWAGFGKPEATGGGIRQLLRLEPGASYAFSAHGRHAARPRGVSVVGVRLKLADGSNRNFALEFDGTEFARKALDFAVPEGLASAEIYFHKTTGTPS